jgi:hypothetical protein
LDNIKLSEKHLVIKNSTGLTVELMGDELLKAKDYQISLICRALIFITQKTCIFVNKDANLTANRAVCFCEYLEPSTFYDLSFNITKSKLGLGYELFYRKEITSFNFFSIFNSSKR